MICFCGGTVAAIGYEQNATQDVVFECNVCRRQISLDPPVSREEWLRLTPKRARVSVSVPVSG